MEATGGKRGRQSPGSIPLGRRPGDSRVPRSPHAVSPLQLSPWLQFGGGEGTLRMLRGSLCSMALCSKVVL